jgi:hypothetical protein
MGRLLELASRAGVAVAAHRTPHDAGAEAARAGIDRDAFEERAAIAEHDGGLPRAWAEGLAKLCVMPCPAGFTPKRWARLVNDAGRFGDAWAAKAAGLGWTALDVFGVDPRVPDANYGVAGVVPLLALLNNGEIVAIEAGRATVRNAIGKELVYLRGPRAGAVALWELGP